MASKHHTSIPWGAVASVLIALVIGSAPVTVMLTLHERIGAGVLS